MQFCFCGRYAKAERAFLQQKAPLLIPKHKLSLLSHVEFCINSLPWPGLIQRSTKHHRLNVCVSLKSMLKPNPQWTWQWPLGSDWDLYKRNSRELPHPFHHMRTQWDNHCLWNRKRVLTRHWLYQWHDLGLPSVQNCKMLMLVVQVIPSMLFL